MKNIHYIKASAGSGKTWSLMDRIFQSVIQNRVRPSEFLVTTFTNHAAAELRSRVRRRFLEKKEAELAANMSDGLIGTVNSISASLLNDYSFFAGLSPSLDIIPDDVRKDVFRIAGSCLGKPVPQNIQEAITRLEMDSTHSQPKNDWNQDVNWQDGVREIVTAALDNSIDSNGIKLSTDYSLERLKKTFQELQDNAGGVPQNLFQEMIDELVKIPSFSQEEKDGFTKKTISLINAVQNFNEYPTWKKAITVSKIIIEQDKSFFPEDFHNYIKNLEKRIFSSEELFNDLSIVTRFQFERAAEILDEYQQYKNRYGLTEFADQINEVLKLTKESQDFGSLFSERIRSFMVDEFQDTNPIQLALFGRFNEIFQKKGECEPSVWVGDAKQSIYGFRGADMALISEIEKSIEESEESTTETLGTSWRSKRDLVRFSNTLFPQVFSNRKPSDIVLNVSNEHKSDSDPGKISAWYFQGKTNKKIKYAILASRIASLIRKEKFSAGDIAVLVRVNETANDIANALMDLDIPTCILSEKLSETLESRLVLAAYQYAVSPENQSAGFIYTVMKNGDGIFDELLKAKSADNLTKKTFAESVSQELRELNPSADETPRELLDRVISVLKIDELIQRVPFSHLRYKNLDNLRKAADEYIVSARLCRKPASLAGFPQWYESHSTDSKKSKENDSKKSKEKNAVNILTYHSAKGLEWPVVILTSLDNPPKCNIFRSACFTKGRIDPDIPLQNRMIHSWANPFGKNIPQCFKATSIGRESYQQAVEELKRLLYVGVTRAKDQLIFALETGTGAKIKDAWLREISPGIPPLLSWPYKDGVNQEWFIEGSDEPFTLYSEILQEADPAPEIEFKKKSYTDEDSRKSVSEFYPAVLAPSKAEKISGVASLIASRSGDIPLNRIGMGEDLYQRFGNAVHSFLAILPKQNDAELARQILKRWNLEESNTHILTESAKWFNDWVQKEFPDSEISTEVPISLQGEHSEFCQGYIDYLIETPEGYVIIDHKTHSNPSDVDEEAAKHSAQLKLYKEGVEMAAGKKVLGTYIHFPILGRIYTVS